jgi:ATP-dependent Lon protease
MTGEETLRGQELPDGGIKDKSLAAHRAGVTTFIHPKRNEADLDDLPANLKDALRFVPVDTIDEALAVSMPDEFHMRRQAPDDFAARQSGERIAARASA